MKCTDFAYLFRKRLQTRSKQGHYCPKATSELLCAKRYKLCFCGHSADHLSLLSADTIFICGLFTHRRGHKGSNCSQAGVSTAAALRDQRVGVRHISLDFTDCCCMAALSEKPRTACFNKREEHVGEEGHRAVSLQCLHFSPPRYNMLMCQSDTSTQLPTGKVEHH